MPLQRLPLLCHFMARVQVELNHAAEFPIMYRIAELCLLFIGKSVYIVLCQQAIQRTDLGEEHTIASPASWLKAVENSRGK